MDDKARLLSILMSIYDHLAQGKPIGPSDMSVLNPELTPDEIAEAQPPTLTEYLGGVLEEMGADEYMAAWYKTQR